MTQITDAGLPHLAGMTQLQEVCLIGTYVTDAGLEHLAGLPHLERLWLDGAKDTDDGVKKLRQALPKCDIRCEFP